VISRTSAKTGILRDSSSRTTYLPVRPVAPATATRVGDDEKVGDEDSSVLVAKRGEMIAVGVEDGR